MNFLAHIYLSGNNKNVRIGNFIGDFVKGKEVRTYPAEIQKGIELHRQIDEFTDNHATVMESKKRLRPKYRHYAPVIVDVFYDHFLAALWSDYHTTDLLKYTHDFYAMTDEYLGVIPAKAKHMLGYMKRDNWLFNYQFFEGIGKALAGMSRRTPYLSKMDESIVELKAHYEAFREEFKTFFPDLQALSHNFLSE